MPSDIRSTHSAPPNSAKPNSVAPGTILHVVQHLRPGGLEVMALELARRQQLRTPTLVVSLEGTAEEAISAWPRLAAQRDQLVFLDKKPGLSPALVGQLHALFRRLRPAAVHTHHIGPLLYAGAAARLAGVKTRLHTEHDAWHLSDPRRRRVAKVALAASGCRLIADSAHVADAVATALGGEPPRVILNGIDTARFRPADQQAARRALGLPLDGKVIGISARLEHVKGVDIALEALVRLDGEAARDVTLAIAGSGSLRATLERQAVALGIADRVAFLGHLDDMAAFYPALDVFCLPSRAEGLPLSLLEAQSCAIPVVATRVGGVCDAVCDATGHLVPSEDPSALASALQCSLQESLARNGNRDPRNFVLKTADLDSIAQAYLELALGEGSRVCPPRSMSLPLAHSH